MFPFHSKCIPIQPQNMIRIDGADSGFETLVECWETVVEWIAGLVDGVVACDPGVVFVVCCEFGPEPDGAVLVVFVFPECSVCGWVVGMPVGVLAARDGVHV